MSPWYLLKYNITNAYNLQQTIFVYVAMTISMIVIGIVNWYAQGLNVNCEPTQLSNYTSEDCRPRTFFAGERFDGPNFTFAFLNTNEYRGESLLCRKERWRNDLWVRGIPVSNPHQEWDYQLNCDGNIQLAVQRCNTAGARGAIIGAMEKLVTAGVQCLGQPVNAYSIVSGDPFIYSNANTGICEGNTTNPDLKGLKEYLDSVILSNVNRPIETKFPCQVCVHNYFDRSVLFKLLVSVLAFATPLRLITTYVVDKYYHVGHSLEHNIRIAHPYDTADK
ncbi:MAG: hypothetical protein J3Q66DRAFT_321698 [Benniella sp.]|nr:MAG: hypothetical protein J3Q66DRAFT_321698 [Benniella sp.]